MSNIRSKKNIKRILACFVLVMLVFTNYAMPLYAVAAETADLFESTLFRKDELSMSASFSDGSTEKIADVNEQVTFDLEINPLVDGYLKQGYLGLSLIDSNTNNFKIVSISQEGEDESNSRYNSKAEKSTNSGSSETSPTNSTTTNTTNTTKSGGSSSEITIDTTNSLSGVASSKLAQNDEIKLVTSNDETGSNDQVVEDSIIETPTTGQVVTQEQNVTQEQVVEPSTIQDVPSQTNTSQTTQDSTFVEELPYVVPQGQSPISSNDDTVVETIEQIQSQIAPQEQTVITNKESDFVEDELSEIATEDVNTEELVNEEDYINQVHTETTLESKKRIFIDASSVTLKGDNLVFIENVSSKTKISITIAYTMGEVLNVDALQKAIQLQLSGTFINEDLEEVYITKTTSLNLGWKYTTNIDLSSEYVKVSPFTVNSTNGTIVENEIKVTRNIKDKKYLPLKKTKLEIKIPTLNNKKPTMVDVMSKGLMATKGESIENLTFDKSNWSYDENSGKIVIEVNNLTDGKVMNTKGEDIYVITYRYDDYVGTSQVDLEKNVVLTADEYGYKINTIKKDLSGDIKQDIEAGDIITYSVSSSDTKISKSNIYANYFLDEKSKTEFSSVVSVKILTSDMLDKLTLFDMQETYIDKDQNEFKATDDVTYKGIKFKYREIEDLLKAGSQIAILDDNDQELYRFTSENTKDDITSQVEFGDGFKNLQVVFDNVSSNGSINVEFVKQIVQSNYTMYYYTMFAKLQSTLRAKVKYTGLDEEYNLNAISDVKDFSESYTKANIFMNPSSLNTLRTNENIEFKISLNNDQKTSDIYKNPSFEIVFPSYIEGIDIQNIKLVNNENLRIDDFRTYDYNGNLRVRIQLEGIENKINSVGLTGGTYILLNCNINVSNLTPKKEDEIKLYFYNEAVSNYWTQTMWKINEQAPSGLIRATNGFDAVAFTYQAPAGLVNAVGIRNYDGMLGFVSSVKQGIQTVEIRRDSEEQIANMELTTLNNTSNPCSDLVLLGRIPFSGNKDVITSEDLGTTVTTKIVGNIKANGNNPYNSIIYYSTNENANKNLSDPNNNWVEQSYWTDITKAKSYLIVVKGTIQPGDIYRYSYPFSIPEDLTFDNKIFGTYGAYYNNISSNAVVYESTSSDKVGLTTGDKPKLEVQLTSSRGEGIVNAYERITYTATVINNGSTPFYDVTLICPVPENTILQYKEDAYEIGNLGWEDDPKDKRELRINLGILEGHSSKEYSYSVKPFNNFEETESFIINKAQVIADNYDELVESKELKNRLNNSNFEKWMQCVYIDDMTPEDVRNFQFKVINKSNKKLENVKIIGHIPSFTNILTDEESKPGFELLDKKDNNIQIDNTNKTIIYELGNLDVDEEERVFLNIKAELTNLSINPEDVYFEATADGVSKEKSSVVSLGYARPLIMVKETTTLLPNSIHEDESFTISYQLLNVGNKESKDIIFNAAIEGPITVSDVITKEGKVISYGAQSNLLSFSLPLIEANDELNVYITFKANNEDGDKSSVAKIAPSFKITYQNIVNLNEVSINILNDKLTKDEEEERKAEEERRRLEEEQRKAEEEFNRIAKETNSNRNRNTQSNNGSSTNDSSINTRTQNNNTQNNNNSYNNNNSNNNNITQQVPEVVQNSAVPKYTITGTAWLDSNQNGQRENDEKEIGDIKVTLIDAELGYVEGTTTTSTSGRYGFNNIKEGIYYVTFEYNGVAYTPTIFQNVGVANTVNSDAVINQYDNNQAVSPNFRLTENLDDVDLGLVEKSSFDIEVHKYLVGATVTYKNGKSEHYKYDNKEIAKLEIKSSKLNGATVELEYQVVLTNVGKVEGYAEQVIDVIPNDMENSNKNEGLWSLGTDNRLYSQNLSNIAIKPGETRLLSLNLIKHMTNENTGVVSNRAELISSISNDSAFENDDNNSHVQNTFIMPATGSEASWITFSLAGVFIAVIVYLLVTKKIKIQTKRVYR